MELVISSTKITFKLNQKKPKKTKEKNIIHYSSVNTHYHLKKILNYAIIYLVFILICEINGKSNNSCNGRVKLTKPFGYITDGKKNYSPDLQCTWLIDASDFKNDTLIILKFTEFETECNWDHLYVFSGDSVFSPLVAAFSGVLIKRSGQGIINELPQLEIRSKQVYLYFYSDTAMNATGFTISYSIQSCQNDDCSKVSLIKEPSIDSDSVYNLGTKSNDFNQLMTTHHCSTDQIYSNISNCNCNDGINSFVCNMFICPNKCSSQGECDLKAKKCNCKSDYAGADCGQILQEGYWSAINNLKDQKILGRALHQSVLVDDRIWVVGGEFFRKSEANDQFIINYDIKKSRWNVIERQLTLNLKRFSHSLVHYNQSLYMYGGILDNGTISNELWRYEIKQNKWKLNEIQYKQDQCISYDYCAPLATTGHTATVIDDRMLIIFGYNPKYGYLNTVQEYHFSTRSWSLINAGGALVKGGFGHTSVYHEETKTIYVFGGHHSFITDSMHVDYLYAYLPYKNKWRLLTPSKSPRYFHTASIINNQMYVYGGNAYNSTVDNNNQKCFSTQFLVYNIPCDTWNLLSEPSDLILNSLGTGRFGHASTVYKNEMYIFGGFGNGLMLNSLLKYTPANCSQQKNKNNCCKMVFTLNCVWNDEKKLCIEYNEEMALLNNRINTALTGTNSKKNNFILGDSSTNDQNTFCHLNFNIYSVDRFNSSHWSNDYFRNKCPIKFSNNNELCKKQSVQNCPTCLENSYNCIWCDNQCYSEKCKKNSKRQSRNLQSCDAEDTSTLQFNCNKYHNCASCHVHPYCTWHVNNACFPFVERSGNRTVKAVLHDNLRPPCEPPCHLQTTCENCTLNSCLWCSSLNRCIESNAYSAVFPLAQCMEWTIMPSKCSVTCATQGTCEQCQKIHRCGWCDDGSNTGSGFCLEGHSRGPFSPVNNNYLIESSNDSLTGNRIDRLNDRYNTNKHLNDMTNRLMNLDSSFNNKEDVNIFDLYSVGNNKQGLRFLSSQSKLTCKADRWFFTECPVCQCNGHSQCKPGTSICNKPCLHDTEGEHCEECKSGFYGNAINRGKCLPCKCNSHSVTCDKRSSRCFCTTKGIVGQYCEKCDEQNHYFGNPKESTCFYNLSIDFQYTFNMSKYEDRHFNKINFMNIPHRPDLDVDFSISCSNKALFNISFGSVTLPYRVLHERTECANSFKFRFPHHEHLFGAENGSFYVNVYSFSYPFILQISFSQHRAVDLVQFFVTFSSCFLTLLILAAIMWKIKQKYDMYRRRQQFFMELEHLASRPFAGILLEISNSIKNQSTSPTSDELSTNQQTVPLASKPSSKLKAFTLTQRSHLKNFLSSTSTTNNDNLGKISNVENPTPIALEPCFNNKAAVLSLIVRLPTGGTGVIPIGQTGIAIASALVSLGPVEQKMHDNLKSSNGSNKKMNNPAFV